MEEKKFDFRFLNKLMYIATFIVICYALKTFGLLEKIGEILFALTPFYVGVVICWISRPLANKLRKWGFGKGIAAIISLVIILGIVALALGYIIPVMATEIAQFVKEVPSLYTNITTKINGFIEYRFASSEYRLPTSLGQLDLLSRFSGELVNYSIDTAQKVISFLVSSLTAIIISFFMVKDMDKTKNNLISLISKNKKNSKTYKMLVDMDDILNSYIRGLLIDSVIVGIMTTILCAILKLKYAVIFGIIITILNFIPYIGAALSYCITTLYAYTVGGPVLALITLVSSIIIQMIDANILQPNIIGKSVKLHPVVVICGLLVFERLFGAIGMLISTPFIALAKIYINYKFDINFESEDDDRDSRINIIKALKNKKKSKIKENDKPEEIKAENNTVNKEE